MENFPCSVSDRTEFPTVSSYYNYSLMILSPILLVCTFSETWSLTLREERRLRVFENRVLRIVFGPKRDEVTGNGESCITRS